MARQVKCALTGEIGSSDLFVKIGSKYYKSLDIYELDQRKKETRKQLIKYICEDILNYSSNQKFPTLITKKLKELEFYNDEVILKTFQEKVDAILYQINQDNKFSNEQGKIFYMFAIISNSIVDVHKKFERDRKLANTNVVLDKSVDIDEVPVKNAKKGSILEFLEEDEV